MFRLLSADISEPVPFPQAGRRAPEGLCGLVDSGGYRAYLRMSAEAQVAELVDALDSGSSGRKLVEVRVFSWAPPSERKNCGSALRSE
jgi:hypothetical protein